MTTPDMVTMLINLSRSLIQVIYLFSALAYLLGLILIFTAVGKLKQIAETRAGGGHKNTFVPLAYFLAGAALLFLPQAITIATNSTFGSGNIIAYSTPGQPRTILEAILILLKLSGIIWFVRGAVLLANSSEPGVQDGPKGLAFLCGGILALNVASVIPILRAIITKLQHMF